MPGAPGTPGRRTLFVSVAVRNDDVEGSDRQSTLLFVCVCRRQMPRVCMWGCQSGSVVSVPQAIKAEGAHWCSAARGTAKRSGPRFCILSLQSFLCSRGALGCLGAWRFPLHFLASDLAYRRSRPAMSATTSLCGTIVALDSSDPRSREFSECHLVRGLCQLTMAWTPPRPPPPKRSGPPILHQIPSINHISQAVNVNLLACALSSDRSCCKLLVPNHAMPCHAIHALPCLGQARKLCKRSTPPPSPLQSPPHGGGGTVTWPKKHRKY